MNKIKLLSRILSALFMTLVALPLHAEPIYSYAPGIPMEKMAEDYAEDTIYLERTFRIGEQFSFQEIFPQLPTRFQYENDFPPMLQPLLDDNGEPLTAGADDVTVIELDIDMSPGWNQELGFNEAEIHDGYCIDEGTRILVVYSMDTIVVLTGEDTYYQKDTLVQTLHTYFITFTVKDRLVSPGYYIPDTYTGYEPDPTAVHDIIFPNETIPNIAFYYVASCYPNSHWDDNAQKVVYDNFDRTWYSCGTPTLSSSDTNIVAIQPDNSYFVKNLGQAVITVKYPAFDGFYNEDSVHFTITVLNVEQYPEVYPTILMDGDLVCAIIPSSTSGSSSDQRMEIFNRSATGGPLVLDRETADVFPWDNLSDYGIDPSQISNLIIGDNISYIGEDVFEVLNALQTIRFHATDHPLDSMHFAAFASTIAPWMFAMGDPQDGPAIPPLIIGDYTAMDIQSLYEQFGSNTVLYVPDSLLEDGTRSIDLYRADPFWGYIFNLITDRTVDVSETEEHNVLCQWLPLEKATGYLLTIRKVNCTAERCDTTIFIPAIGIQGLVDWDNISNDIPQYLAPRRMPMSDDGGGGMTLTITIKSNCGSAHNDNVQVTVSGLEAEEEYTYTRDVLCEDENGNQQLNEALSKGGLLVAPQPEGIENTAAASAVPADRVMIYDIMGRALGNRLEALPNGIYIISNGAARSVIMMR